MNASERESPRKSQGLAYLKEVRPAAVEHLLKFFGESARHLDPKTRFLISVVTKVISGSERGLRQYVKRALESGASPDEIIDAVLCAYPCAGLTKVVDAVDVIIDMGLPGFSLEALAASEESEAGNAGDGPAWHAAVEESRVPAHQGVRVDIAGRPVAIFRDGDAYRAIDDRCPHRGTSLAGGMPIDGVVACPDHDWKFRLSDGACLSRPRARVRSYPTRVVEGRIEVEV